jgi:selenide, water dikinase
MKLTEWTTCGGCAAKWGGAPLGQLVRELAQTTDPALLLGLAPFDDAAVYRLSDDVAVVSTTDFFPPLVDDPADFGAIAAANACSDVFAMGGKVMMALNIAAFPEHMPTEVIAQIFEAAAATVSDAGGSIAGGNTIRSAVPIFGLAVQGLVHPDRVWTKAGARPGDRLLLSKPLGTGIALAGSDAAAKHVAITGMRELNRAAAETLALLPYEQVHAVTDVTGFGLAGHGWEMAERSGVEIVFDSAALPLYPSVRSLAASGVKTGGHDRNQTYLGSHMVATADPLFEAVVLDPQTSGGLLASVDPATAVGLIDAGWWQVGEVRSGSAAVFLV